MTSQEYKLFSVLSLGDKSKNLFSTSPTNAKDVAMDILLQPTIMATYTELHALMSASVLNDCLFAGE